MHGANPVRKLAPAGGGGLIIVQGEPFLTIQGEGPHAGLPATFIRLWGCHLQCYFCDTDFESDPKSFSVVDLVQRCNAIADLVVLTGGEPMRQDIGPLCDALCTDGKKVQVETAGTFGFITEPRFMPDIVVSPKGPRISDDVRRNAIAWKYIITSDGNNTATEDGLPFTNTQDIVKGSHRKLARPNADFPKDQIYLQPMDELDVQRNAKNLQLCIRLAQRYGYRVSIQQHKYMGVE